MNLSENWKNYKKAPFNANWHQWGDSNIINTKDEFNAILTAVYNNNLKLTNVTNGGHLSKRPMGNRYAWSKTPSTNTFELVVVYAGQVYKFVFWPGRFDHNGEKVIKVSGRAALNKFRKEAGHLVPEFALTDNNEVAEVKKLIEKPKIELSPLARMMKDFTYEADEETTIFHLDIHSAYPAGVAATTPVLKKYMEDLYWAKEHGDPDAKLLLNAGIGAMQSLKITGRRYPELSRRGIAWTNAELNRMSTILRELDCSILAYNTDGIWVISKNGLPKLNCIGPNLGQWDIDHVVEKIRFKSAGAYEYIENGQYKPVIRGRTRLDAVKPREQWQWGDIFNHDAIVIRYQFNAATGFIEEVIDG